MLRGLSAAKPSLSLTLAATPSRRIHQESMPRCVEDIKHGASGAFTEPHNGGDLKKEYVPIHC